MRTEILGSLTTRIVGGTDRQGGGDGPVVVLLHGYGAPGDDLVPLHRVLDVPRGTRFVFPHAPIDMAEDPRMAAMGVSSRAWWEIDLMALEQALARGRTRDLKAEHPPALPAARAALTACIDEVTRLLSPSALVVGGFSQGAMLALDFALHDPRPIAALALMSGTFLSEDVWRPLFDARAGQRVVMSHGSHDPLLPFETSVELKEALIAAGWKVDFVPFRGQHEIPPVVLSKVSALITEVTS
jgi:phospholipase/carboxylesterase